MTKYWKFVREAEPQKETVQQRDHYWHYGAEVTPLANSYMVKVVIPIGGFHDFHRHPEMDEILYVLRGSVEQWIENEKQVLNVGDSVYIERDVVHGTFNIGAEDLEFLAVLGPSKGWEAGTIDMSDVVPYSEYRKT